MPSAKHSRRNRFNSSTVFEGERTSTTGSGAPTKTLFLKGRPPALSRGHPDIPQRLVVRLLDLIRTFFQNMTVWEGFLKQLREPTLQILVNHGGKRHFHEFLVVQFPFPIRRQIELVAL